MAAFIEALLKERLWYWLETQKEMEVEGEVNLGTGRIDLIAKTPDDEIWGIELKSKSGVGFGSTLYDQSHRYMESGALDRIFFASHAVDGLQNVLNGSNKPDIGILNQTSQKLCAGIAAGEYTRETVDHAIEQTLPEEFLNRRTSAAATIRKYISSKLDGPVADSKSSIPLTQAMTELQRARCPTEMGIIHIPLNLRESVLYDIEKNIDPDQAYEPHILRDAEFLSRETDPVFARREEPWVRHCIWREYGGLPEAYLPNVRESDQAFRPIDLLAFSESPDPTDAVEAPDLNEVVGVEAKGESSFGGDRMIRQLSEFLQTKTLSRLYLAVPQSLEEESLNVLSLHEELDEVGILVVDEDGTVSLARRATNMIPQHDGYMNRYRPRKLGYGDIALERGKDVISPFITEEEAERLKNSDAAEYAQDLLTDNSELADTTGWISASFSNSLRPPESEFKQGKTARSYLLKGRSADPYHDGMDPFENPSEMKQGYVRLTITDFEADGDFALKLHFGRGSWEGGYIWLAGDEVKQLKAVLVSLETISGGEVPGQGKVLDLETYPFDRAENEPHRVSGSSGEEEPLILQITSSNEDNVFAKMRLGEGDAEGVDIELTKPQWLDLIATIDILQTGNHRELPGEYSSYPRIGPSGEDTWSLGTDIEKQNNPDPLPET